MLACGATSMVRWMLHSLMVSLSSKLWPPYSKPPADRSGFNSSDFAIWRNPAEPAPTEDKQVIFPYRLRWRQGEYDYVRP